MHSQTADAASSPKPPPTSWLMLLVSGLEKILALIAAAVLLATAVWIVSDVTLRFLFNSPIRGTYELIEEYMMPAIVFFGAASAFAKGKHVAAEIFYSKISAHLRRHVSRVVQLMSLAVGILFLCASLIQTEFARLTHSTSRSSFEWPLWPAYLAVSLGFLVLCVTIAFKPKPTNPEQSQSEGPSERAEEGASRRENRNGVL